MTQRSLTVPWPKRFVEGDLVEVRQKEKGLRGAWFAAVIVGVLPAKRIVEYEELLSQEGTTTKLRETVNVSAVFDGQNTSTSLKSAARRVRSVIRPRPIPLASPQPFSWTEGTCVDCWYKDAWWEGIINESVTMVDDLESHVILTPKIQVEVYFPGEYETMKMQVKDMRLTQNYHEDGTWSHRNKNSVPTDHYRRRKAS